MKIIENTPNRLIIENNPILLAIFISLGGLICIGVGMLQWRDTGGEDGFIFIVAGLVTAVGFNMAFVRRTQVIFDAAQDHVELRRRSWFGYSTKSWKLRHLQRAFVQQSTSTTTNRSRTFRAVMEFRGGEDAGDHPITIVYSGGQGAARTESTINTWLAALDRPPPED